ncbi:MAG: DUF2628 domain-containing protein [Desulfovibrio sp.]|jgi:hypothetical protein|nr:DUF2628 domain-containing protein [Desulfovibrio sp.]
MSIEAVLTSLQAEVQEHRVGSLLSTYLHKPRKAPLFQAALGKFLINGHLRFAATWSWWAFFGASFYFLYRKMYLFGLISFFAAVIIAYVDSALSVIVPVTCAISAKYLYCKKFIDDLEVAGYPTKPDDEMNRILFKIGGYNNWAIVAYFLLIILNASAAIFFFDELTGGVYT